MSMSEPFVTESDFSPAYAAAAGTAMQLAKDPISEKRLEANRRNALKSTGPRTEEGRQRSKLNACRHNLTGQLVVMTAEEHAAMDAFTASLIAELAPAGVIETQLAQRIATDNWRLNRAAAIETNLLADGLLSEYSASPDLADDLDAALIPSRVYTREAKNLQLLTLYEQRLNRAIEKNMKLLKSLQAERKAQHDGGMQEAMLLLQSSEIHDVPYEPATDGFVFSKLEILTAIQRDRRLQRAMSTDLRAFDIRKAVRSSIKSDRPLAARAA